MQLILNLIEQLNHSVNSFVWGPLMLIFFLFVGFRFSIETGFFQIRGFRIWISYTILSLFHKDKSGDTDSKTSISPLQALTTALASTFGTGNIAGVATAIAAGGPGAIFWMWVSAFAGMMTHYAETVLGVHYRCKNEKGNYLGGPMVYMEKGLNCKWLAVTFSVFCVLATFGIGNMSQSNSLSNALHDAFGISKMNAGFITAILVGFVMVGGIKRIAKISEALIPFMSFFYLLGALCVIITHISVLPAAFFSIFHDAFQPRAAFGGTLGYGIAKALKIGIARGVFTNEAGLGSSVMVHAASAAKEPVTQGMWGIFEVFADTIVVCTITALTILCSGVYQPSVYLEALKEDSLTGSTLLFDALPNGVMLTADAFATVFGSYGIIFVSVAIVFFAFATLLGWSFYGERSLEYLFGLKSIPYYRAAYLCFIVIGAVSRLEFVWSISDTFNGLMAIPNLIALTLLSGKVIELTNDFFQRNKA